MKVFETFMRKDYNYGKNYIPTIPEVLSNESLLLREDGSLIFKPRVDKRKEMISRGVNFPNTVKR
jgi:hypothetical protein